MTQLPIVLRDKICEACGWRIHTYYCKCRAGLMGKKAYSKAEEQASKLLRTSARALLQKAGDTYVNSRLIAASLISVLIND